MQAPRHPSDEGMRARIDLVWLGEGAPATWPSGQVRRAAATPAAVAALVERDLPDSPADAWLFWDGALGSPDPERVLEVFGLRGDVWHAGLRLGTSGLPELVDYVRPVWMFNRDPDPRTEATSWRLSLRACLVRRAVLEQLGGVHPQFDTLDAAALELGHRWQALGALVRHVPGLVPAGVPATRPELPYADELRFGLVHYGAFWSRWALGRAVLSGDRSPASAVRAWRRAKGMRVPPAPPPYRHPPLPALETEGRPRVTVLIATLDRYPYLRTLLGQLREQTVAPDQIIVVDQTAPAERDTGLAADFPGLPLLVLHRDVPGQCSSRNAGLERVKDGYVVLLDDDVEIRPDFLEEMLRTMAGFGADSCSGIADEVGAGPVPPQLTLLRASDLFPAGITMVDTATLRRTGGFDMAFERRSNEDGELGLRMYLSGALMILNPAVRVLHHRAPRGGLRAHGARVVTHAGSRNNLLARRLPAASEIYLVLRYFTPRQLREQLWLRVCGTAVIQGGPARKLAKAVVALALLPGTLLHVRRRRREAYEMLRSQTSIPALYGGPEEGESLAAEIPVVPGHEAGAVCT